MHQFLCKYVHRMWQSFHWKSALFVCARSKCVYAFWRNICMFSLNASFFAKWMFYSNCAQETSGQSLCAPLRFFLFGDDNGSWNCNYIWINRLAQLPSKNKKSSAKQEKRRNQISVSLGRAFKMHTTFTMNRNEFKGSLGKYIYLHLHHSEVEYPDLVAAVKWAVMHTKRKTKLQVAKRNKQLSNDKK